MSNLKQNALLHGLRFDGFYLCLDPEIKDQVDLSPSTRSSEGVARILLFFPDGIVGIAIGDHDTRWSKLSRKDSCYKEVQKCLFGRSKEVHIAVIRMDGSITRHKRYGPIFNKRNYAFDGKKIFIGENSEGIIKKDCLDIIRHATTYQGQAYEVWELYEFVQFKPNHIPPEASYKDPLIFYH
jgi:hypothetical protein